MYYPYLRAKQYELKALREFSAEHAGIIVPIVPIIEPVKQDTNALLVAIEEMFKNSLKFALILNPEDGDYKHKSVRFSILENDSLLLSQEKWIPAFLYSSEKGETIRDLISRYRLNNIMLIFRGGIDLEDKVALDLINNEKTSYVVNSFGAMVSRRLKATLQRTRCKIVRLDDCFKARTRNVDYSSSIDEFFSNVPFYAQDDGFDGYSDYTTLPSDYIEGGMMPYALVIHLSYLKSEDEIYVHHFISDDNETNTDVKGKFYQAASKVEPFFKSRAKTSAVQEIIKRAGDSTNGYPGLGYIKKLSIKNHLDLILSLKKPLCL